MRVHLFMRVSLFIPCFIETLFPRVGMAMVRVLERLGHTVDFPEAQTCCGQPPFNSGYWAEARGVAEKQMEAFRDAEVVVSASGSCGSMFRVFYPELFHHHAREAEAKSLASRTWEFSEFLVNKLGVRDVGARFEGRATFHDGRHGLRELGTKTGVPLFDRYLNWKNGKISGDKDITDLNSAISTVSSEYAKILSGSSASISGVSATALKEVNDKLNSAMTADQLKSVISIWKAEASYRLTGQKSTIS